MITTQARINYSTRMGGTSILAVRVVVGFSYLMATHNTALEYLTTTRSGEKGRLLFPSSSATILDWKAARHSRSYAWATG